MSEDKIKVFYDERFIMVNYDIIMSGQLTAYEIAVYVALCAFANNHDHSCYPSYTTLAEKAGCSRSTAIRIVASLLKKGVIEKKPQINEAGEQQSNIYIICTNRKPFSKEPSTAPVQQCDCASISKTPAYIDAPQAMSAESPSNDTSQIQEVSARNGGSLRERPELDLPNYIKKPKDEDDDKRALKQKIEYDYFCREMPDRIGFIDNLLTILLAIKKSGNPEYIRLLDKVDSSVIIDFMDDFKHKPISHVQNYSAWLQKVFLEYLRKCEAFRKDFWR